MGDVVKKLVSLFGVFLFLGSGLGSRKKNESIRFIRSLGGMAVRSNTGLRTGN
jgi:hypothetical protein